MLTIFDRRGKAIGIGCDVCYVSQPEVQKLLRGDFNLKAGQLVVSHVEHIEHLPGTGWAEVGDTIKVRLANGYVATGDAENGGWGLLKLPD